MIQTLYELWLSNRINEDQLMESLRFFRDFNHSECPKTNIPESLLPVMQLVILMEEDNGMVTLH